MHCLILNGNPQPSSFDGYLAELTRALEAAGHSAHRLDLRELRLRFCNGCWSCWYKTPGRCAQVDDMEAILREMVRSDLVIWASPLILGTISALLKKVQDRFIPIAHPYIEIVDGECHHRHRYAHNADLGLILEPQADDTEEDIAITRTLFERFSRNTRTALRVCATTQVPVVEVLHAARAA